MCHAICIENTGNMQETAGLRVKSAQDYAQLRAELSTKWTKGTTKEVLYGVSIFGTLGGGHMPRPKWNDGLKLMGRPRTAKPYTWDKRIWTNDEWHPKEFHPYGVPMDATPAPGNTYTRATWPPRGRGRGESLISTRRVQAKVRALEVLRLHRAGHTYAQIGAKVGLSPSGAYRALKRLLDRHNWNERRARQLWLERHGLSEEDLRRIQYLDDMGYQ